MTQDLHFSKDTKLRQHLWRLTYLRMCVHIFFHDLDHNERQLNVQTLVFLFPWRTQTHRVPSSLPLKTLHRQQDMRRAGGR